MKVAGSHRPRTLTALEEPLERSEVEERESNNHQAKTRSLQAMASGRSEGPRTKPAVQESGQLWGPR